MAVSAEMTDMIQCKPVLFLAAMVWFRFMVYGGVSWCVVRFVEVGAFVALLWSSEQSPKEKE